MVLNYNEQYHMYAPYPDSKVHGANMGPIWGRQDPGGPHDGPMNFAVWLCFHETRNSIQTLFP